MFVRWLFAWLHQLGLGIGLGAIWARARALRGLVDVVRIASERRAEILAARARVRAGEARPEIVSALEDPMLSPYLHHFLDEENKHMIYFGRFCTDYANKIYPDKKLVFPREHDGADERREQQE